MTSTNRRKLRQRRAKTPIAALAALAAFTGGTQALAPATAVALVSSGAACSGGFWIDQFVCIDQADGGGGGGSGAAGAGPAGGGGNGSGEKLPHETIVVIDPTKKPKAPVGGPPPRQPRDPDSLPPRDGGGQGGPRHSAASPRCEGGHGAGCRSPEYKCLVYGERLVFNSRKECDEARRRAEKSWNQDCAYWASQIESSLSMPSEILDDPVRGTKIINQIFGWAELRAGRGCAEDGS